jgi:hypothetical protein
MWTKAALVLALLAVVLLSLNPLAMLPLHHDEALYATWALEIVSGRDPWLILTPIDKPPLFIYTVAGAMKLLGVSPTIARLPGLLATVITIGLTFQLGQSLYSREVGLLAAWLTALSPFTILFAPTAFTDPLLVMLILAGCLAAARGRPGWAGICLGLAIATKQQGVFFVPLVMVLLIGRTRRASVANDGLASRYWLCFTPQAARFSPFHPPARLLAALFLTLLPLLVWDLMRAPASTEFLEHSLANYGGLTGDVASFSWRWRNFVWLLSYATGSPVLNGIFLIGLPLLLLFGGWKKRGTEDREQKALPLAADLIFFFFSLLFLLGHALLSFQVWDRYLLGLIPLLALLLARVLLLPWLVLKRNWLHGQPGLVQPAWLGLGLALVVLLGLTLARPVQDAVNGRYPLGSHSQALSGIEQIVAYLQGQVGANTTLYHRWLGTHWRFYLWGYPYDLQYWGSPQELAARARPGHLIAFPAWRSDTEARLALAQAGLALHELVRAYHPAGYPSIILYQVEATERQ